MAKKLTKRIGLGTTKFSFQVNNLFYISAAGHDIDPESYGLNSGPRSLQQPRVFPVVTKTIEPKTYTLKPNSPLYIIPFPRSATDKNPNLTQN